MKPLHPDLSKQRPSTAQRKREHAIQTNRLFLLALARAARRGLEHATFGTFVDPTPPIGAKRYQPEMVLSGCGSPAEMCTRAHVHAIGSRALMK
ncbi:hypothetical protein [Bradyrhizobium sp. ORS 86]|uniref:hypothetical protein n=1 Tax=Bradyrhizobium sp. ORS 86 TaxID=1685970 RepID=UPI00388D14C5